MKLNKNDELHEIKVWHHVGIISYKKINSVCMGTLTNCTLLYSDNAPGWIICSHANGTVRAWAQSFFLSQHLLVQPLQVLQVENLSTFHKDDDDVTVFFFFLT